MVRILDFPKDDSGQPDDQGEPVFTSEYRLVEFTGQMLSELRRILAEHGLDGYHSLSHGRGFPLAEFEALQQLRRARKAAVRARRGPKIV